MSIEFKILAISVILIYVGAAYYFFFLRKKPEVAINASKDKDSPELACVSIRVKGKYEMLDLRKFSNITFDEINKREMNVKDSVKKDITHGNEPENTSVENDGKENTEEFTHEIKNNDPEESMPAESSEDNLPADIEKAVDISSLDRNNN